MPAFKKRVVRLAVDITGFSGLLDSVTSAAPQMWNAVGCEIQVAFFNGDPNNGAALADVSLVTSVKALISDTSKGATVYIDQAMANPPGLDVNLTLSEWQSGVSVRSGFERACHAVVSLEGTQTALLDNTKSSGTYWLAIHGTTSDDATDPDLFGAGSLTIINGALPVSPGALAGSNIVPNGATYDGSGHYTLTVGAGQAYVWTQGANDTSVTNGSATITDGSVWVAAGATVTLNGTSGQLVTASVWYPVVLTVAAFNALFQANIGSSGSNKLYYGTANPNGSQVGSVGDEYNQIVAGQLVQKFTKLSGTATNTGWA